MNLEPHKRRAPELKRGVGLLKPDLMVNSVTEVDPAALVAIGIEGVILDLDNTLVLWHREEMADHIVEWLERVREAGLKICILSNSVLSKRSDRIAERLGCPNVRQARKPSRSGFRRAIAAMQTTPHTTAMIGDQMFTDILGGNRMGVFTIMVEFVYTRYISRPPERLLLRYFRRRGQL
jgi:HAD superfamily phosphatase (TIGR01668 family)